MADPDQKMLKELNYQIPHTKVLMKTHVIPSGVTRYTINNLFKGRLPDRIAVAMVADKAVSGSYTANPFNFQNFGLNYLVLHVNSELVPRIALEPNFTTGDYMREYITVLEALGFDIGPNTWALHHLNGQMFITFMHSKLHPDQLVLYARINLLEILDSKRNSLLVPSKYHSDCLI